MPQLDYPDELKKSFWDKKKGALEGAGTVEDLLKALQKKHDAVDWAKLGDGWTKNVTDEATLKSDYEVLDKLFRTRVAPLKLEANGLAAAAEKAAKAKDAAKPLKDAAAQISRQVSVYAKGVEAFGQALEQQYETAVKNAKPSGEDDENSSVLVDPGRLLKQLRLSKDDPKRQIGFALLDDGKKAPQLAVHPKQTGRSLMNKVSKELDIRTGGYGVLMVDGTVLKLVVEKKLGGMAKRIRIPVKASSFKITKVVILSETGDLLEEDNEAEGPELPDPNDSSRAGPQVGSSTEETATSQPTESKADELEASYRQRAEALEPRMLAALKQGIGDASKIRAIWAFAEGKATAGDFKAADNGLKTLEALLNAAAPDKPGVKEEGTNPLDLALQEWSRQRDAVVSRLRALSKQIAEAKLPEARGAIIEVNAVFKQLTAEPRTSQQVNELIRWVGEDDVVSDVSELDEDIRTPLLQALRGIEQALPSNA